MTWNHQSDDLFTDIKLQHVAVILRRFAFFSETMDASIMAIIILEYIKKTGNDCDMGIFITKFKDKFELRECFHGHFDLR